MRKRDILASLGILAAFAAGAALLVLVAPNFFATEANLPPGTATAVAADPAPSSSASQSLPTASTRPASPGTGGPGTTPAFLKTTTGPAATTAPAATPLPATTATPVATTSPAGKSVAASPGAALPQPQITQLPFTLPKGLIPSNGARSCPDPLPLEQIKSAYLGYWDAVKTAYHEGNPELLQSFVDQTARDGQLWQGERAAILKTSQNGYWLDYQIEHTDPLIVKINPYFGDTGECQVSVFDGAKLTVAAKKIGTDEPYNEKEGQPHVQQYKPSHSFEMNLKGGRWLIAGEGAGEL